MTIYFRNLENVTIIGEEGDLIKRKIAYALEHDMRDWITIYNTDGITIYNTDGKTVDNQIPIMVINLAEVIAVR